VVTVAYLALAPRLPLPRPGTDAAEASWLPAGDLLAGPSVLAFDHHRILADGVERARSKLEYTPLAAAFCPPEFTVAQLRQVYEAVWATRLDPRNFHRKATGTPGFLSPTGEATAGDRGRPAQLYRMGPAELLYPPMLRASPDDPAMAQR
jgi:8-oxo-dGTP diphosphatase